MHPDSTVTGIAVFAAVYLLIVWLSFRWARWRVNRVARDAAASLEQAGARIVAQRPTTSLWRAAEADFEVDGATATLVVRQWGRNSQAIGVRIPARAMPAIWIRRERGFDRVGKALRLEREVQLGVKEFDDAVFIASVAPDDVVREALGGAEVQRVVRDIVGRGFAVFLSHDGVQATTLRYSWGVFGVGTPYDGASLQPIVERLRELGKVLPSMSETATAPARKPLPSIAVIAPAFLSFLVPMLLLSSGVRELAPPPMDASHVLLAIALGVVLWPIAMFFVSRGLRGRPLAMFEVIAIGFALLVSLPFVGASGLFALNRQLDGAAPTPHHARVVAYYKRNAHTVYVAPWGPDGGREKVIVSPSLGTLNIGDALDVDTHPGAFGWTWVSDVRRGE